MQCVILAGGLGTRMRPITDRVPKTLVPVNGVPFADHQLRWLAEQGLREVVYSIGRHGELVRAHVGDGSRWGLDVRYVEDGPALLGTAGALRKGIDEATISSPFLVVYGDSYLPIRVGPVVETFHLSGRPALMTVYRNDSAWGQSNAVYANGRVTLYDKRRPTREMVFIDYGLSVMTAPPILETTTAGAAADLSDVFHRLSTRGELAGFEVTTRFFEIGSPEGLRDLERYLADRESGG